MDVPPPFRLLAGPTPLHPLPRLGAALGFDDGALWVKRDDLTPVGGGGNKVRKLELLVGDALAQGCDVLVTAGAAQSNHVRSTGAAAAMAGLGCTAVVGGRRPAQPEGNLVLDHLFGVDLVWTGAYEAEAVERALAEAALRLAEEGRRPYEVPLGGASDVGTLGYVLAAAELVAAAPPGAVVYTAVGTGGTLAGLVVGLGSYGRVRGVDVGAVPDVARRIADHLVPGAAARAGRPLPTGHVELDGTQIGDGYGARTAAAREALVLAARLEGLVLDPVYSGKALAGLMADRRAGRLPADQPTVLLHTGGAPALFTGRSAAWLAG